MGTRGVTNACATEGMEPTRGAGAGSGTCRGPRTWTARASWPRRARRPAEPRTPCSPTLHSNFHHHAAPPLKNHHPKRNTGGVRIPRAIGERREKEAGGRWSGMAALRQHPRTHRPVSSGGTTSPISAAAAAAREGAIGGSGGCTCLGEVEEPRNERPRGSID